MTTNEEEREEERGDALSEDLDPSLEGERPHESYPNPTQKRIDEDERRRETKGWPETSDDPHEGEEGQDIV
jgi:hypothetical protein